VTWALPITASTAMPASSGVASALSTPWAWSRRPPQVCEGEFGIGGVLVGGGPQNRHVEVTEARESRSRDRVEVADRDIRCHAEGERRVDARVGRNDHVEVPKVRHGTHFRTTRDDECSFVDRGWFHRFPPPALPGSGSRVGGGGHPLSPSIRRAPRGSGELLRCEGYRRGSARVTSGSRKMKRACGHATH
jgi:hypothetical protein